MHATQDEARAQRDTVLPPDLTGAVTAEEDEAPCLLRTDDSYDDGAAVSGAAHWRRTDGKPALRPNHVVASLAAPLFTKDLSPEIRVRVHTTPARIHFFLQKINELAPFFRPSTCSTQARLFVMHVV